MKNLMLGRVWLFFYGLVIHSVIFELNGLVFLSSLLVDVTRMMKQKLSLKGRALRYLSMREHSRIELVRKLSPYAEEAEEVEVVLNWLEASNFMSAERFSDSLVNRRSSRFGNQRVKENLSESELERALAVLHRKFPHAPVDFEERLKQSRFLQQRGFSGKSIQGAMRVEREDEAE